MRRAATLLQLPLFLAAQALGSEDVNYDPDENYRPRNVTGLDYYYYPWIGSYYNGSAVFTISDVKPRDDRSDSEIEEEGELELCGLLRNITYTWSYPAILAITETEPEDERPKNVNPIDVSLFTSYSNFTQYFSDYMDSSNMQTRDMPFVFESIEMSRYSFPTSRDTKPDFNLTVAEDTGNGLPFRVTGSSELEQNPLGTLQMNMSTCSRTEGWWGVVPISLDDDLDDVSGVINPTLQLAFDDSSASFSIRSWIVANTLAEEDEETPRISARLTIEFLGRIDAARSDVLNEGTPVTWTPSMGFGNNSLSSDYESGALAAARVNIRQIWSILGAVLAYIFI
ncbi:uncharacterized protein N7446_000285 [Penicillium canescens]|uniref:Uncharacterized protein n=1 Tax=Penicillium canescens TaxID=5083 RepID=A0AAD6I4U1_PENCN|nr:uncharacterized protein N7446_000285 [Penicillium canescens]KAJ6030652.1 hypothetical protein N7460_010918 [Penicillium canescens]KAJ6059632.1 hypothetical protein N7444_003271 [Penicillium canescens]KAJ6077349.1 hypothetical protein N7446_000285 [Penicillium canescens]